MSAPAERPSPVEAEAGPVLRSGAGSGWCEARLSSYWCTDPDDYYGGYYGGAGYTVRLKGPGLDAEATVSGHGGTELESEHQPVSQRRWVGLDDFLLGLAARFRGWDGVRAWESLCHDFGVEATWHTWGHVRLRFWLTDQDYWYDESWQAAVTVTVEAGAELETFARQVRVFLSGE
ncbi:MAG: DUF6228 family protein [Micrococcales bacterium]|nr:DUF6228 family protein [Micrococcales bacterium]